MAPPLDHNAIENCRRQQEALANFGRFAFRNEDLHAVLREASRLCAEGLGVKYGKILRYRPERNDLVIVEGFGWKEEVRGTTSQADTSSPAGRAFVTKEPVLTLNLPEENFDPPRIYIDHDIKSSVNVIVQSLDDAPYGILEVDSEHRRSFNELDICFIAGFANVVAEALAHQHRSQALRAAVDAKDRALAERDLLARELHHRVRNSLQVIVGQLEHEASKQRGSPGERGLNDLGKRVLTMARTYDHLLGQGFGRIVDFAGYLRALCEDVRTLYAFDYPEVTVSCSSDPLHLDIDRTTSLGLALHELIANSYEHAFPKRRGTIAVSIQHDRNAGQARILISDDGVGFHEDPQTTRQGVGLVRQLVRKLGGVVNVRIDHGTTWEIIIETKKARQESSDDAPLSIGTGGTPGTA